MIRLCSSDGEPEPEVPEAIKGNMGNKGIEAIGGHGACHLVQHQIQDTGVAANGAYMRTAEGVMEPADDPWVDALVAMEQVAG